MDTYPKDWTAVITITAELVTISASVLEASTASAAALEETSSKMLEAVSSAGSGRESSGRIFPNRGSDHRVREQGGTTTSYIMRG